MQYNDALSYIHDTLKFGIKLGLHRMDILLELMGNPHKKLKYVHIAGTNGKGSTAAFISSILAEAGYKVGIYTSPYLLRFTERIRVNEMEITMEELARLTETVKEKIDIMLEMGEEHPTEFEIVTAIAFQYFLEMGCDIVVLEVGLGGRFDSTNVIDTPLLSVITTISYDHMDKLGNTLAQIAFEKAGIIKEKGDVVLYPQSRDAEKVFEAACAEKKAMLHRVDMEDIKMKEFDMDTQTFDYRDYESLRISLLGEHQIRNAIVALRASELLRDKGLDISESTIRNGLLKAKWPGRLEILCKQPLFLIDGAHNAEGARILAGALEKYFPGKGITLIIGVLKDKDYKSVIEAVVPIASRIITVTPNNDRALTAEELSLFIKSYCNNVTTSDTINSAVRMALEASSPDDAICAFGSLYYIGEIRNILNIC